MDFYSDSLLFLLFYSQYIKYNRGHSLSSAI